MNLVFVLATLAAFAINGVEIPTRADGGGPAFGGMQSYYSRANGYGPPFGGLQWLDGAKWP